MNRNEAQSTTTRFAALMLGAMAVCLLFAAAEPATARQVETRHLYVGVDYETQPKEDQTAFLYYWDEVEEELVEFPRWPNATTGPTSRVNLYEWLLEPEDDIWFVGVSEIKVYKLDGTDLVDVTDDERFTELNHHFVTQYAEVGGGTPRVGADPCNNLIRPVAAGSELTTYVWPDNYGFFMNKTNLTPYLVGWAWHWSHGVEPPENDGVFIRFELVFELRDAMDPLTDTNITWLTYYESSVCGPHFCAENGANTFVGPQYTAGASGTIVMALPHVHDHATSLRLMKIPGANDPELVKSFTVSNDYAHPAHHHCDDPLSHIEWHNNHTTAQTGHLPVGGLTTWLPTTPPTFANGDKLWVEVDIANPHSGEGEFEEHIDNMGIVVIVWAAN